MRSRDDAGEQIANSAVWAGLPVTAHAIYDTWGH